MGQPISKGTQQNLSKNNPHTLKNWPLIKKSQFLSNPYKTW